MTKNERSAPPEFGLRYRAMKGLTLSIGAALLGLGLAACAPRVHATHYERWSAQDAKRKADAAAEAKKEAAAAPAKGAAPGGAKAAATPPPPPPPPPPPSGYNSLSGETPPVQTATKSRVMKPAAEEDDIY
jgi:hypothetical protein